MKEVASSTQHEQSTGDSTREILSYWLPEVCTTSLLIFLPLMLDAYIVAQLGSTSTYGALGLSNNLLHSLVKLSEAISVAATVTIGRHNGAQQYPECGKSLGDAFWSTIFLGFIQLLLVFFGCRFFFAGVGASTELTDIGIPFLKIQSIAIFFTFVFMAFLGFFRGVKDTKTPLYITITGLLVYAFADYAMVLGKFGFPEMRLIGSATAALIRFSLVSIIAGSYVIFSKRFRHFFDEEFFSSIRPKNIINLLKLSLPIMADKSSLSLSYIWLFKMITPIGTHAVAAMDVIKNLERFAFIPAIAFAQVVTFLVSNRIGAGDSDGAKHTVKKILILSSISVSILLIIVSVNAEYFIGMFDHQAHFTSFAAKTLPLISPLVVFDLIQLILAGALRGSGDVRTVMWTRTLCCGIILLPISYLFSHLPSLSDPARFALTYGSFYFNTAIIGFIFLMRIRGRGWLTKRV